MPHYRCPYCAETARLDRLSDEPYKRLWRLVCGTCGMRRTGDGPFVPEPLLQVLNFSGGKQSSALLWMVLRGDIEVRPDHFLVLNADPGMENSETYDYVEMMFERCREAGIEARRAQGPNLYQDLVQLKRNSRTRIDNPPYWTLDEAGKTGKLGQKCTQEYKIRPMDRELRRFMWERFGIAEKNPHVGYGVVEKWIGFAYDEVGRVKEDYSERPKYLRFAYPLIDRQLDNAAVLAYFRDNDLPLPPRSVCNACFANGVETLREMHDERPDDWAQAVAVDESVRDLTQVGIRHPVYVSRTMLPLKELARRGFRLDDQDADAYSCDSGYCFT